MDEVLTALTSFIAEGAQEGKQSAKELLSALFSSRYYKRDESKTAIRDVLKQGSIDEGGQYIPFAGLIHPDSPPSGPYGGMSLVWFPVKDKGSLLTFVVGTRGISSDVGILTRPGHRRRIAALRRMLAKQGVKVWSKPEPANVGVSLPKDASDQFSDFRKAIERYGEWIYCMALVSNDNKVEINQTIVRSFFDLYSYERGWDILTAQKEERDNLLGELRMDLFEIVTATEVNNLLKSRHFVILQGPPGTGKTRLAALVKKEFFNDNGMIIQFHPSITYEDFVIGLSPDTSQGGSLHFKVTPGWLYHACQASIDKPFLLVIDEINRADLGKILGEAIYLFEPGENRTINLSHTINGDSKLSMPPNLYVLGTMNTADRSIANVDIAIRRRFSFMTMMPDRKVVTDQGVELALATIFYDRIIDMFVEHAPNDALNLMPGHSYFLAKDKEELKKRFRYELLPLLDEYIREGYMGPATTELSSIRNSLEDLVRWPL